VLAVVRGPWHVKMMSMKRVTAPEEEVVEEEGNWKMPIAETPLVAKHLLETEIGC